ncbi:MAG: threonine dehydratase [Pseudomonadota bacterium]
MIFTESALREAAARVHRDMMPTPQIRWPMLEQRLGCEIWVKHENHAPTGAFKVRGGITFIDWLRHEHPEVRGIVTATRGNHGQSQARAASAAGLKAVIVVPTGNSAEKNAAMRAFGAEVIIYGDDFEAARTEALRLAEERNLFMVPSFHVELVRGVASYALELFDAAGELDSVYVPVGCGSGICGVIAVRDALGLSTEVVAIASTGADAMKRSFDSGEMLPGERAQTFADGVAVRVPVAEAFAIYGKGAARFVAVDDDAVAEAIRTYWHDTHNLAEGAGALPLAALMAEKEMQAGKRVGVILCGGNIDTDKAAMVLAGQTPPA